MGTDARVSWRVKVLDKNTAGTGLLKGYHCSFTIPGYWDYGHFFPKEYCALPGKRFLARAGGKAGAQHVYMSPAFRGEITEYAIEDGPLYAAWQVAAPERGIPGGQFSLVGPAEGPWVIWCNRDEIERVVWTVHLKRGGEWVEEHLIAAPDERGALEVQVTMEPEAISVQIQQEERGRFVHDPYSSSSAMRFGSGQILPHGGGVVSSYRYVFVDQFSYPYHPEDVPDGPEDVWSEDDAVCDLVCRATPQRPRATEGDLIELADGRLFLIWSDYYEGKGWDGSPARLVAKISGDGGRTWGEPRVVVYDEHGTNVMSVSLLRAENGDILLAYYDRLPGMGTKGMVLRRSGDEAETWSKAVQITPENGRTHVANNASFRRLSSGRMVLACREYIPDAQGRNIRWPYALYSDDEGRTWRVGRPVPDPGLTEAQRVEQNVNEPSIAECPDGRLLMTMRTIAGGQFFSYSEDGGETWTTPYLSPLVGACSPAAIQRIPGTDDILAIFTYGYTGRTPLTSAVSSDGGRTWRHLKLVEQSRCHGYCYTSITFVGDRVFLTYMHFPMFTSLMRFDVEPGYTDMRLVALPISWFYRDPRGI